MSFVDCVLKAQADGKITKTSADYLTKNFNGNNQAELVEQLRGNIKREKWLKASQAVKENQLKDLITSKPDTPRNIMALLTKDISGASGYSNIEYRSRAIQGVFDSEFGEAMEAMRTKFFGLTDNQELSDDIVRALYGEQATPEAMKFAKQWNDVSEHSRTWFNRAGGSIAKLKDWRLPQGHEVRKMRKAGFEKWHEFVKDKIDTTDMDWAETTEEMLKDIYDTITSNGLNKLEPGKIPKGVTSNLAEKMQDHRMIKFKDADSYLTYQKEFGNPDVFATMSDHLRNMSDQIAKLEILGPNPEKTYNYLKDIARKENGGAGLGAGRESFLDAVYNVSTGVADRSEIVSDADFALASFSGGFRAINTSAKLGGAVLSSIADLATSIVTSGYNNMAYRKILGRQINTILQEMTTKGSAENIKAGVRLGLVADAWSSTLANSRFAEATSGKAQKMAEVVLRASGINAYTEAGRKAFGMEFASTLADDFAKPFNNITMKDTLTRHGFTSDDWDIIRKSKPLTHDGVEFFDVQSLYKTDSDLAVRVMEMIQTETDYAVLVPDARVRAITTAGKAKGTVEGEVARAMTQFKSFPITMLTAHIGRAMSMTKADGLAYGAKLMIMSTVLGGLALELKDLSKGKTSRLANIDEDNWGKFVMASLAQGGGAGIFGDFFFQDQSRYGNSALATMAGPLGTLAEDTIKITSGNLWKAGTGKDVNFGSDIVQMGKQYLPGQNLWYTRLLTDRLIFDSMKQLVDPKYNKKVRRQTRKMKKETGQEWLIPPTTF